MTARDTTNAYGRISRYLHWLLFALVVIQFSIALTFGWFPEDSAALGRAIMLHESFGLLILVTSVAFLGWRLANPRPGLEQLPAWQSRLARTVHAVLYAAIIAQPVLGSLWAMSGGYGVPFFGLFEIPPLIPESDAAGDLLGELHEITAWVILVALGIHVLAALYHHFQRRDAILVRMGSGRASRD